MSRHTGPSPEVREVVIQRDQHRCALCGKQISSGEYSIHHRRSRGMGGTRRTDANSPANLALLDGSGTTGCHGFVEANPDLAREWGFRLAQHETPSAVAIKHAIYGLVWLDEDGGWTDVPPEPEVAA